MCCMVETVELTMCVFFRRKSTGAYGAMMLDEGEKVFFGRRTLDDGISGWPRVLLCVHATTGGCVWPCAENVLAIEANRKERKSTFLGEMGFEKR